MVFSGGRPTGVERLGIALEPEESWESKGVEDPRITFLAALGLWVMTYTAYGPVGPRVAIATSADLARWSRLGLATFGGELDGFDNKDAAYFPEAVRTPTAGTAHALLHRPANEERPGIWVSFAANPDDLTWLTTHRHVAGPEQPWEALKIGAGTPPVRTTEGWLLLYQGVSGRIEAGLDLQPNMRYRAGAMVLDAQAGWEVVWRSTEPLRAPETLDEREGIVANVVFPTAIDGSYVFYGMADARIGAARLSS